MSTLAIPQRSTTTWNIDPTHATAEFKVKHMMIAHVKGQFSKVKGVLIYGDSRAVDVTSDAVSKYIDELRSEGYSAATCNRHTQLLGRRISWPSGQGN